MAKKKRGESEYKGLSIFADLELPSGLKIGSKFPFKDETGKVVGNGIISKRIEGQKYGYRVKIKIKDCEREKIIKMFEQRNVAT